jgi:hypothetical protein
VQVEAPVDKEHLAGAHEIGVGELYSKDMRFNLAIPIVQEARDHRKNW